MPQSSEELRKLWGGECGVGEDKAIAHLEAAGYTLTRDWCWKKPTPDYQPSADDIGAATFLVEEWDFGGFC